MRANRILKTLCTIIVVGGLLGTSLFCQSGRGTARQKGIVVDKDDQPIKGAAVVIEFMDSRDPLIKHETKTNKKGEFIFAGLGYGRWQITASYKDLEPGVKTVTVSQVNINPVVKLVLIKSAKTIAQEKLKQEANLVEEGNKLYEAGKYREALDFYQKFLADNPEFYQLYVNIGNCHKELGELDPAMAAFQKVIDSAKEDEKDIPLKAKSFAAIGEMYLKKDDTQTAMDYFKKSIDLNPKDEILAYNVGEICFAGNKNEEAIKYYDLAAQIKPKWAEPHLKKGYVYMNLGDFTKAIDSMNTFLKLDPENPQAPVVKDIINSLQQ
jgi:Tfp pilus assembly protein PilF